MDKIKIITDSTCDLPKSIIEKYDIEVKPLVINLGNESYLDGVDIDVDTLLEKMEGEGLQASTSQVVPARFIETYERYIKEGYSIISMHISSHMSGTFQSSSIARDAIDKGEIHIFDSKNVTSGLGILVLKAARLKEEGRSVTEILEILEERSNHIESNLAFESLDNLVRGGRLSKTAGVLGSVLGIKVILGVLEGEMAVKEKMRGCKKAVKYIIEAFEKSDYSKEDPVMLLSIKNKDIYEPLKQYLEENNIDYIDNKVGCTVGIHSGPRACGLFYFIK